VAAFDAMILLARDLSSVMARACASNGDAGLFSVDLDLIAREAGQLGGEDELSGRLVQVDRGSPAWGVGTYDLAKVFVERY
jgi:hypothetical protein